MLALVVASFAFAVVGPADAAVYAEYNYLHFNSDAYVTADQRRVAAGGPALDIPMSFAAPQTGSIVAKSVRSVKEHFARNS